MTLAKPLSLQCLYCGSKRLKSTTQVDADDYKWRRMQCKLCAKAVWWGAPRIRINFDPPQYEYDNTRHHMAMIKQPKMDDSDRSTANLYLALPVGATLDQLITKSNIEERKRHGVEQIMRGRQLSELSVAEKIELKYFLESFQ